VPTLLHSEDLATLVVLRRAWHCRTRVDFSRRQIAGVDWMCKLFRRGRQRRCAVKEKKEPSLLSFKGSEKAWFPKCRPQCDGSKCLLLYAQRTISTPLCLAGRGHATCPRPLHLHMVL
jgi:hypothetical protein